MCQNTEFSLVCIWTEYRDLFVNLCIQTEYKKIRTRTSSLFRYFSRSATVTDIQWVLIIWKMRNLTLERKIVILKIIAISRIVFLSFITNKIIAPQKVYDDSLHEWKLILLYLIEESFGTSFKLHSNLIFKSNKTKFFQLFYREIILNWIKNLAMMAEIPPCVLLQYLWYNKGIQVGKVSIHFFNIFWMLCFATFSNNFQPTWKFTFEMATISRLYHMFSMNVTLLHVYGQT